MRQQGTQARTPTRKDGRRLLAQPAQGAAAFLREDDQGDDDDIDDEAEHEHILEHAGGLVDGHHQRNAQASNQVAAAGDAREDRSVSITL